MSGQNDWENDKEFMTWLNDQLYTETGLTPTMLDVYTIRLMYFAFYARNYCTTCGTIKKRSLTIPGFIICPKCGDGTNVITGSCTAVTSSERKGE